jgi:asparagine synthase (glutamine-hydrolysing)
LTPRRASTLAGSFGATGGPPLVLDAPATEVGPLVCRVDGVLEGTRALADAAALDPSLPQQQLLAAAFARLGEDVFAHVHGSFVALVWDRERRAGAIARDRVGDRPLHIAAARGGLVFAPELHDLLERLPSRPQPDETWLAHFLARRIAPAERTPYVGVQRLPAGWLVRLAGRSWSLRPWWRPRPPEQLEVGARDAAELLREQMAAAVGRALAGAESPGVMLSGGFDSSSAAALAARERPLRAYSAVFPDHPNADESSRIAAVRATVGTPGVEHEVRGGGALAATFDFLLRWEVPPATPNVFLWEQLLRRAASDGVDALLDGEGGDELFGCSTPLLADLLRRGRLVSLLRMTRRVPGMGEHPTRRHYRRALELYALRDGLPPRLHAAVRTARRRGRGEAGAAPALLGPAWVADTLRERIADSTHSEWKRRAGPRWWAALVHAIGPRSDAMGAADQFRREAALAGLRLVHPWRDTQLADYVLTLPPELAFDPSLDRPLARAAMRGLVPDAVRLNDRKPYFNDLLADALSGPDRALAAELAGAEELARYVRRERVDELLERPAGPAWPLDVWRLAAAGAWLRAQHDPAALAPLAERAERATVAERAVPAH